MSKILLDIHSKPKEHSNLSSLEVSEFFSHTIQGEGRFIGYPAAFLRTKGCTLNCTWCFVGNTKISTKDKLKLIKDIKVGDEVVSWDTKENKWCIKKVTKLYEREVDSLFRLSLEGGRRFVFVTKEHPILVKEKGWVRVEDLQVGDILLHLSVSERMKLLNPLFKEEVKLKQIDSSRQSGAYEKDSLRFKKLWENPDYREKASLRMKENNPNFNPETAIKGFLNRKDLGKKSSYEIYFEEKFSDLCEFVGDGRLIVNNLCPDFLVKGQRKVIEIWSREISEYLKRDSFYCEKRRERLKERGYEVLFLPFEKKDNLVDLRERVMEFVNNGLLLTEKKLITKEDTKSYVRLSGGLNKPIKVYNFEVEDTNTYTAETLIVHNCDTMQVWRQGSKYSLSELFSLMEQNGVIDFLKKGAHLVLTGGSPLLQQSGLEKFLLDFIDIFGFKPFVEVENECTLVPEARFYHLVDQWNCSPKLSNSLQEKEDRYNPSAISFLKNGLTPVDFKFVISTEEDWEEVEEDFLKPGLIELNDIILMPEGETQEELSKTREKVALLAVEKGVRFSDRLHITIWNRKVGV